MTPRAAKASRDRRSANAVWVLANEYASKIGPRAYQTPETQARYERAQEMLTIADEALVAASIEIGKIPGEEFD